MNIIPVGNQCYSAKALKSAGLRKVALPFDYLGSPLPSIVSVLKRLKSEDFNMQEFLKEFLSTKPDDIYNILGFWLRHFVNEKEYRVYIEREKQYTKPSQQDILKCKEMYRLNDVYCNTAHPEVYEMFERRFNRLKDMFFTQENILVYNDIHVSESCFQEWIPALNELMKLNPLNRMIYITYSHREILPIENVYIYKITSSKQKVINEVLVRAFKNIS